MTVGMGAALLWRPAERIVFVERASAAEARPAERPAEIARLATADPNPRWTGETAELPTGGDWSIMRAGQLVAAMGRGLRCRTGRRRRVGPTHGRCAMRIGISVCKQNDEINGG